MDDNDAAAVARVRGIFEDVVAGGFRAEMVEGASDEEIDAWAAAQGVRMVPAAVREILRIMGKQGGAWLPGTTFGVRKVDAEVREEAGWCVDEADERGISHGMRDPAGMLVVTEGGAYVYLVVDGSDLAEPDPPMWVLFESGKVTSTTFRDLEPGRLTARIPCHGRERDCSGHRRLGC
ncbi:SMI1/KNR4 family protein [Saccharothrix deserti]|uniref:SMI1/KNR4 family protein n=1 Tax=Saccharothrix deserti TaxID=2593674 RepID=UPI00131A79E7|nr:SMI1/KNR4 family protein [Saccharothrix deserti]